jgi:hypothetical protein
MVKQTANLHTSYEILEEKTAWMKAPAEVVAS